MARDIGIDAEIERIIIKVGTGTSNPPSGYGYIYNKNNLLYMRTAGGVEYNLTNLHFLDDHTDLEIVNPVQNNLIIYDEGDGWNNSAFILNTHASDVIAPSPNNGDVLKWVSASGAWVAQTP